MTTVNGVGLAVATYKPVELTYDKWVEALHDLEALGLYYVVAWPSSATDVAVLQRVVSRDQLDRFCRSAEMKWVS